MARRAERAMGAGILALATGCSLMTDLDGFTSGHALAADSGPANDSGEERTIATVDATGDAPGCSTLTLRPTDTFLNLDDVNQATEPTLNLYTWPSNKVANAILLSFDLTPIPPAATVSRATLYLWLREADSTADALYTVTAHRVLHFTPSIASATGRTYDGTNAWTANGCCANGVPLAQADISSPYDTRDVDKTTGFKSWDATTIIDEWLADSSPTHTLLLNADASRTADHYRYFSSMEDADPAKRPYLLLEACSPP